MLLLELRRAFCVALEQMSVPTCCIQAVHFLVARQTRHPVRQTWARLIILPLTIGVGALVQGGTDPVQQRGLKHTETGRALSELAISSTNVLLSGKGIRLVLSTVLTSTETSLNIEKIPVYLVQAPSTASTTPAVVPKGCRCIFVNPSTFYAFVKEQSTGSGRLTLDPRYVLAFILLHEVGHLVTSTAGADFANGELSELNIDPSRAKANEEDADMFAADLVRTLMQRKPASALSLEASSVAMELGSLSWNMQAYRSLDEFGATVVGKPSVFFDKNLSHPNLGWRILRMNELIHHSPETAYLLDTFEAARRRGANPEPLYVAPNK